MRFDEGELFTHRLHAKLLEQQQAKLDNAGTRTQALSTALLEALELVLMLADNDESPAALEAMGRRDELMVVLTEAE